MDIHVIGVQAIILDMIAQMTNATSKYIYF